MTQTISEKTELGNYFIANYPPFSFWKPGHLEAAAQTLNSPAKIPTPLGLYVHIPFCRKRCKFCYFRVYTDKNARDVDSYLDALLREISLYAQAPVRSGRELKFIYFGGGTPSYLSVAQLEKLFHGIRDSFSIKNAGEATFECEPGTLQQHKLAALRELGVTRLSLGVENFSDEVLEENGRAHHSQEIFRAYSWARDLGFPQINIDLIAGMIGDSEANWHDCLKKTIELAPDCVTIYQLELPFNTVFSKEMLMAGQPDPKRVADWPTKRKWMRDAFETLQAAGYQVSSGYTLVKDKSKVKFVYRDELWHGADMFGTGVASFGHMQGIHLQNVDGWEAYLEKLAKGELPLGRALPIAPAQQRVRELILQLKTGHILPAEFDAKFGGSLLNDFQEQWKSLENTGMAAVAPEGIQLSLDGLLQVDRLLPRFFEPQFHSQRYT
ncbi:MAG: coproporphyrinogen III oxidase family protein [Gemmataceae bacterium]|nr:coproporphyrinogen III oxidase family protein [Gemmataceae bacterium]